MARKGASCRQQLHGTGKHETTEARAATARHLPPAAATQAWIRPLQCTGEKGKGQGGKPLHYLGCPFHRVVKGFVCQGGDILFGNGTGGESIHGKKFKDDAGGLKVKLDSRGLVAMGNTGKNSNSSQFFFTFGPQSKLNGKHVVFGRLVEGMDILDAIEATATGTDDEKPGVPVVIADCGVASE